MAREKNLDPHGEKINKSLTLMAREIKNLDQTLSLSPPP